MCPTSPPDAYMSGVAYRYKARKKREAPGMCKQYLEVVSHTLDLERPQFDPCC
jgi:hypothetical protein